MLLIDLTHTSHTHSRTGIQRLARALRENLATDALSITRDPFLGGWRALESWELAHLTDTQGRETAGSRWPRRIKWRGRLRRMLGRTSLHTLQGEYDGLIEPELFGPPVARDLPKLFRHVKGPRVALFLDAIAIRYPELSPPATVARFPGYMRELLSFDGVAAISEESRDSLLGYWKWLGVADHPPVLALPLGVNAALPTPVSVKPAPPSTMPVVLSVGTLEGRKNHLALFEACEQLWSEGRMFQLHIIGHVNAQTGGPALARLRSLQTAGRPLRYEGPASDAAITQAYAECAFTVYPSIAEGFGLPVIESLSRGKACVCSGRGAIGEISQGGGCVALDAVNRDDLASAIARLLGSPTELAALSREAAARTFKSWSDYTRELTAWLHSLPVRSARN